MNSLYLLLISFFLVFLSELGDKTQLMVFSFSAKLKTITILLGVALGSFFSHGIAILFGSMLGNMQSVFLHDTLEFITYTSFILIGFITLKPKKYVESKYINNKNGKTSLLKRISNLEINYLFIIVLSIVVGEIGDKTFLASIGLGISYPDAKLLLVLGAILGMIASDTIAILLGKFLSKKIPENTMKNISAILFLLFGFIGLVHFFANEFFYHSILS
jgi:putative Ca2+/H+ antiporter (TMEM165/GDT1 family)